MLTHDKIYSNAGSRGRIRHGTTSLSFIPLSHIFERMAGITCVLDGRR